MTLKIALSVFLIIFLASTLYSQDFSSNKDGIQILKSKILSLNTNANTLKVSPSVSKSGKSPALALLFSIILPGAGHYYIDRMDVGKYFLGLDAASWLGLVSMNIYGDALRDDARKFSVQHAAISNIENKRNDFYTNIGNYSNVYEYNNDKLTRGEYSLLYNTNDLYWNWDNSDNRGHYESQRKSSERIYNTRIVFGSLLIVNRIVSGISAFLLANKQNKKSSSLHIEPKLIYKDYSIDGVKINISKNF